LLLAGWIAGPLLFLLRMVVGLRQVHSLRRFGLPWCDGQAVVDRLALDVGIRRRVEVLVHQSLPAPVTCGLVHPAVVLHPDAQNWNAEDLNRALVHELEHVRRGDWVSHCVARMVCAMYWFHPLVWIASRRLALEAERACDGAVLGRSDATAYADQLVGLARRLSANRKSAALAMANRSDLSARVGAVLDSGQRRGRAGKMLVTSSWRCRCGDAGDDVASPNRRGTADGCRYCACF
jgi:beta-lactamase regulating signal transducer with metallopeptidase domain